MPAQLRTSFGGWGSTVVLLVMLHAQCGGEESPPPPPPLLNVTIHRGLPSVSCGRDAAGIGELMLAEPTWAFDDCTWGSGTLLLTMAAMVPPAL